MQRNILLILFVSLVAASPTYTPTRGSGGKEAGVRLDPSLQAAAQNAVGKQSACVIAMDPRNGRILALVNEDMAVRKAYPPGSIAKLLTAFAGLEEGVVAPDEAMECRNFHSVDGRKLICTLPGGHGSVRLEEAIALSCNVYFYRLGEALGPERFLKHIRRWGIGSPVPAWPGPQAAGHCPSPSDRLSTARAAIGDGMSVTALQMAVITSAIANGGFIYSSCSTPATPAVHHRIRTRPGTFETIRNGMRMAVFRGTAKDASIPGIEVCGKTGSPATLANPQYRHGWFVGFAPYNRPEIVVVVFAEWGHGGTHAAPIARRVFEAYAKTHRGADR